MVERAVVGVFTSMAGHIGDIIVSGMAPQGGGACRLRFDDWQPGAETTSRPMCFALHQWSVTSVTPFVSGMAPHGGGACRLRCAEQQRGAETPSMCSALHQ